MPRALIILLISGVSYFGAKRDFHRIRDPKFQEKEDFFVFFQGFCMDSTFQMMRIKFPLLEVYLSTDLNNTITNRITKSEWKYRRIKRFPGNTFEYYFDSFDHKELPDKDEMVYSILGVENGIQVHYYFKREEGKWFLVKIEDLST